MQVTRDEKTFLPKLLLYLLNIEYKYSAQRSQVPCLHLTLNNVEHTENNV
jgi:hypothetical protein